MYDLIIIGLGPAGLTAAIYAACFKLNHATIGQIPGGQMSLAPDIINYPGFVEVSGKELTERMTTQAIKRGSDIIVDAITEIKKSQNGFQVFTVSKNTFETKTIILATGVERRRLNVPGEVEYLGKGVQYCASCETFDYAGKVTAVVGGANAATQTALQLSHAASKVYIVHRGPGLNADPIFLSQMKENKLIAVLYNSVVKEIKGDGTKITSLLLQPATDASKQETIAVDRVYIEIGGVPGTALLAPLGIQMDLGGYIAINEQLATNIPGIYAAGDVISHKYSIEQISSAVGSGARAAISVFAYLKQQKAPTLWGEKQIQRQVT